MFIADYKLSSDAKTYEWFIEVTCNEVQDRIDIDHVRVQTVTFYSRHYNVSDAYYDEMIESAYNLGLGTWLDWEPAGGTKKVDQFSCGHPAESMVDTYDEPVVTTIPTTIYTETSSSVVSKISILVSVITFFEIRL